MTTAGFGALSGYIFGRIFRFSFDPRSFFDISSWSGRVSIGVSGVDWNKVHNNSLIYGLFGLTASLIPQGSVIRPYGNGWASAFCISGEIVIDVATWFYEMVDSGEIKLPRPVFV